MNPQDAHNRPIIWYKEKPLLFLVLFMWVLYSVLCVLRHWHFMTNTADLGNFDQMVWHYSRLEAPASTNLGLDNSLGDHFSPILALFAPLFWIYPHAEMLLIAQAFLFAITLIPIFLFSEKRIGRNQSYLLLITFMFFWGVQHTIEYDFHPDVCAVPLIAFAVYFIDVKKWRWASLSILALLFVKEDLTLLVAAFGVYLAFNQKVKLGLLFILTGILFFYLEVMVWVPYFYGAVGNYQHWYYTDFGGQPSDSIRAVLRNPLLVFDVFFSNGGRLKTLLYLFAPFLFLPLFSRQAILMAPLIAAKLLANSPNFWGMGFHYSATVCPLLVMASAEGLAYWRQKKFLKKGVFKNLLPAPVYILMINLILIPLISPWRYVAHPAFWTLNAMEKTGYLALALIPPDASVATQGSIEPHLAHRKLIYQIGSRFNCDTTNPDFLVACKDLNSFPVHYSEIEACLNEKIKNGYKMIFDKDGWLVLENPGDGGAGLK